MSSYVLPQIITRFRERYPRVKVSLVEANSVRLRELLHNDEVDMIVDNFQEGSELYEKYPLMTENILLCVSGESPINEALKPFRILPEQIYNGTVRQACIPAVDVSLFRAEDFVLLKTGNDMHYRAMAIFEKSNITPRVTFEVDQLNISYALAESGLGICFVTDTLFKYRKHNGNVVLYKLDCRDASRMLYAVHKKNRYCTRAMSEFITIAQEIIKD